MLVLSHAYWICVSGKYGESDFFWGEVLFLEGHWVKAFGMIWVRQVR
jgi:hypothetical protein